MQNELLRDGLTGTAGMHLDKRGSVQAVYEVQTIKVDRKGARSFSKRMSVG